MTHKIAVSVEPIHCEECEEQVGYSLEGYSTYAWCNDCGSIEVPEMTEEPSPPRGGKT